MGIITIEGSSKIEVKEEGIILSVGNTSSIKEDETFKNILVSKDEKNTLQSEDFFIRPANGGELRVTERCE